MLTTLNAISQLNIAWTMMIHHSTLSRMMAIANSEATVFIPAI